MVDFVVTDPNPDGMGTGLIERNYSLYPIGYNSRPFDLPLIPKSEYGDRKREKERVKSTLPHLRKRHNIPSTNQGQTNYCWAHSSASAVMLSRVAQGQKHVDLSATSIATRIKNFRNVGGWGSQSLEFIAENGICRLQDWPQGPAGIRRDLDSPTVWQEAKSYKVTEWMDLDPRNADQLITCLLLDIPVVSDFNWWEHSVCSIWFDLNPFRVLIWNSWGDGWGENGEGWLDGRKAFPDGMIAPRVVTAI